MGVPVGEERANLSPRGAKRERVPVPVLRGVIMLVRLIPHPEMLINHTCLVDVPRYPGSRGSSPDIGTPHALGMFFPG